MPKLGNLPVQDLTRSAVRTKTSQTITAQGGVGYERHAKGELFLFAAANMVGEDTFYEGSTDRDARFRELVEKVTLKDPDWVAQFVPYLRSEMQMRTASIVMAAESAMVRLKNPAQSDTTVRSLVSSALQRADEPGEFIAYWAHRTGKRTLPGGVQRGVADATKRLLTEYAALKYDGQSRLWRLADVIELAHPKSKAAWQAELFRYLLDRRHHPQEVRADLSLLPTVQANLTLNTLPVEERRALLTAPDAQEQLKAAGFTWEELSGWLQGPLTAQAWEAIIPSMGYMALLRNLRNFEQAGISRDTVRVVCDRLANPDQVARSRQFPLRFLSAYKAVANDVWKPALNDALDASLRNVPQLPGRTLVLVDMSGSMFSGFSDQGKVQRAEAAALFGVAVAKRSEQHTLVCFGTGSYEINLPAGGSVLPALQAFQGMGGTNTADAFRQHYDGHDRVICLTDEQTGYGQNLEQVVPDSTWLFTFNLAGYQAAHATSGRGKRATFAGLTDKGFKAIPILEAGVSETWPF
jgi:hypothetical protein